MHNNFTYLDHQKCFCAEIPSDITNKESLLHYYNTTFAFPYFGFNWDALKDCLCDLSWLPIGIVVVSHAELPCLNDEDLTAYCDLLNECPAPNFCTTRYESKDGGIPPGGWSGGEG